MPERLGRQKDLLARATSSPERPARSKDRLARQKEAEGRPAHDYIHRLLKPSACFWRRQADPPIITTIPFLHPPLAHCRRLLKKTEARPAHRYTHRLPTYIHRLLTPVAGRSAHRRSVHRPIVLLTERFTERSFHRRSFHRRLGFSRFTVGMCSPTNRFTDRSFHRPLQESGHRLPAGRLRPPPPPGPSQVGLPRCRTDE